MQVFGASPPVGFFEKPFGDWLHDNLLSKTDSAECGGRFFSCYGTGSRNAWRSPPRSLDARVEEERRSWVSTQLPEAMGD
ncbi:hypothetical protein V6N11_075596 [Hibiscus sabdariffa]|uniref:Uncharacterized protein n=1 Tax=Hibiscus sabdariffa TaxID=183260 RepID=A0ABR2R6Z0_9ROSI